MISADRRRQVAAGNLRGAMHRLGDDIRILRAEARETGSRELWMKLHQLRLRHQRHREQEWALRR